MDNSISSEAVSGNPPLAAVYLYSPRGGHWKYTLNLYRQVQTPCILVTAKEMALPNHRCAPILRWSPGPHRTLWSKVGLIRDHLINQVRLIRLARRSGVRIVHFQSFEPISIFLCLPWLKSSFSVLFSVHNVLPHRYYSKWTRSLEIRIRKRIYQAADRLFVFSRYGEKMLLDDFGIADEKIQYLPMGCHEPLPRDLPPKVKLPPQPTFLMFGGYRANKGFEVLREAFLKAKAGGLPGKLLLAGKYPPEMAQSTRELFFAEGFLDELEVINHFIGEKEIDGILRQADFLLLPYTRFTSQSGQIFLAYAYHLPVIASRVGGLTEVIEEDGTGILIPPGDVEALTGALFQAVRDWHEITGSSGFDLLTTKYAWSTIGEGTDRIYRFIAGED